MLSNTTCKSSSVILPSSDGISVRASSAVSQQSVPMFPQLAESLPSSAALAHVKSASRPPTRPPPAIKSLACSQEEAK